MLTMAFQEDKAVDGHEIQEPLTRSEKSSLRSSIYEGDAVTAMPKSGRWANIDILECPQSIIDLTKSKKTAVLEVLLDIVKGGRPSDSMLAAGYMFCIFDDPPRGRVATMIPVKKYDKPDAKDITPREMLVDELGKLMKNAK